MINTSLCLAPPETCSGIFINRTLNNKAARQTSCFQNEKGYSWYLGPQSPGVKSPTDHTLVLGLPLLCFWKEDPSFHLLRHWLLPEGAGNLLFMKAKPLRHANWNLIEEGKECTVKPIYLYIFIWKSPWFTSVTNNAASQWNATELGSWYRR